MKNHNIILGDCLEHLRPADCIFMDPPDNIGLKYEDVDDQLPYDEYSHLLHCWIIEAVAHTPVLWVSFNARWTLEVANTMAYWIKYNPEYKFDPGVQVITFYQQNGSALGNAHRPLWRLMVRDHTEYPDDIRIPSWRQLNGDKRADKRGKVPGDVYWDEYTFPNDVYDYPRVPGNAKVKRKWHETQLHEDLVERAIRLTTRPGDHVLDPFGGTGTTLRVCKRIDRQCTLIEKSKVYYQHLVEEHPEAA